MHFNIFRRGTSRKESPGSSNPRNSNELKGKELKQFEKEERRRLKKLERHWDRASQPRDRKSSVFSTQFMPKPASIDWGH